MLFKVLVFAMLSSASGWGLPSNDSLLSSNESTNITGGVDGARDLRQLMPYSDGSPDPPKCICDRGSGSGRGCDGLFEHFGCSFGYDCDGSCDGWLKMRCDSSCDEGCEWSC